MATASEEKKRVRKQKTDTRYNTESMLNFSEIRGNTLIMKDGGLRAIIKVFGLNLDLKNEEEQQIVVEQYKKMLNGIDFPMQILVRSTYLDLTDYIYYMSNKVNYIENDILRWQGEKYVSFLQDINSRQGLIYTKEFYIIVPYYAGTDENVAVRRPWWRKFMDILDSQETPEKIVARYRSFLKDRRNLDTRCNSIIEGLRGMGIIAERLELHDIISLLFKVYNPNSHKEQAGYSG